MENFSSAVADTRHCPGKVFYFFSIQYKTAVTVPCVRATRDTFYFFFIDFFFSIRLELTFTIEKSPVTFVVYI